jgi:hypothetical protein
MTVAVKMPHTVNGKRINMHGMIMVIYLLTALFLAAPEKKPAIATGSSQGGKPSSNHSLRAAGRFAPRPSSDVHHEFKRKSRRGCGVGGIAIPICDNALFCYRRHAASRVRRA